MTSTLIPRPLVIWDGFCLRCDLDLLERFANEKLPKRIEQLRELRIGGEGSTVELSVRLSWQGLPAQVVATVSDLRVHRRFLGCRVESLRGPLGVPLPISVVAAAVRRYAPHLIRLDPADRILLVDLRHWVPEELRLGVSSALVNGRMLEIELAPGSLAPTV